MKVLFMGRRPHAVVALRWLVEQGHEVVRVVCPSGTGRETPYWTPTVKAYAQSQGLPITTAASIHGELESLETREDFHDLDLVVSFLYWERIRQPLISAPKFGCINFHPAPLPDYRGLGGYNFAILNKQSEWGTTAHYVDSGFDSGPIIEVVRFPFDWQSATALSLERATRSPTIDLFQRTVSRVVAEGWLTSTPNVGGRYYTRKEMDDAKLISPDTMSGEEIELRIRAFWYPPFPGAQMQVGSKLFTLVSADILDSLKELHRGRV